jgi:hypothetical protein
MKVLKVETQPIHEHKRETAHCYIFPQGEGIVGNLMNRHDRPYTEWKKLMPEILKKAGFSEKEISQIKPSWSQKCGCGCGCSPGFRLKGASTLKGDVFADVQN